MASQLTDSLLREIYGHPGTPVVLAYTDTSAATASALTAGVLYMFQSDTKCYITFAASPTATANDIPLAADVPYFFKLNSGLKCAAIRAATSGNLKITPMTGQRV